MIINYNVVFLKVKENALKAAASLTANLAGAGASPSTLPITPNQVCASILPLKQYDVSEFVCLFACSTETAVSIKLKFSGMITLGMQMVLG